MAPNLTAPPKQPELIVPSESTPHEIKTLSDIDDQEALRVQLPIFMIYKRNPHVEAMDPVNTIREALAKTLVYYYPYAGTLVEGPDNKFLVDCTAEGVVFVETEAEFSLDQLCHALQPPRWFPELLLSEMPGSDGMVGCPFMLVQVTRLKCGGYVIAIRFNHVMCDALGSLQFVNALSEMARGASAPSVIPVWERELLCARHPPRVTHAHPEYEADIKRAMPSSMKEENLVTKSFSFGPKEIKAIRENLPPEVRWSSKFELITACLWRSRTRALQFNPGDNVRITCTVALRGKSFLDLPLGYYGNAAIFPARVSKAKTLCDSPLGYAVKLVKEAKEQVSEEYTRSTIDFIATRGRPKLTNLWSLFVSDTSRVGFHKVDFGWGKPVYGGVAMTGTVDAAVYTCCRNEEGEEVTVVPMVLPATAMERFEDELRKFIWEGDAGENSSPIMVPSKL